MSNLFDGIKGLTSPNPKPNLPLREELARLFAAAPSLRDLYPETKGFRTAALGIKAAVGDANLNSVTLSIPSPLVNRLNNGELFARYYSPYFAVLTAEYGEGDLLKVSSVIGNLPPYYFSGFIGLILRYAVSKDGGKTPSDNRANPKARYNSNPGFAIGYGGDYLSISRAYAEKEVSEELKGIVERFKASLSAPAPEKPKK